MLAAALSKPRHPDGSTQRRLLGDLQVLVEVDPATATRALLGERLGGHEIVRGLHADADVDLLSPVGQLDLLPELGVLRVVLAVVELLAYSLKRWPVWQVTS